jgi:molybdopterin synthase catalytic subunit/molybdopterin converting factor small subunit
MKVTVQFFSYLRQRAGTTEMPVELPAEATAGDLLEKLGLDKNSTLVAVGVEFVKLADRLNDGDVVSLMPPLQGGVDDELLITDQPIPAEPVTGNVGGVVVFYGIVRDREEGRPISALEYTAYREMAEHQFRKLIDETKRRWPLHRVRVVHRLGVIRVGEPSLLVRVEAAHRGEAFAAAQFIIDELKQKVPIWKQAVPAQSPAGES